MSRPETTFGLIAERQIEQGDVHRHYKAGLLYNTGGGLVTVFARDLDLIELGGRVESALDLENYSDRPKSIRNYNGASARKGR